MRPDLAIIHSPVGGGHKAAALALLEAARRRGLSVEVLDTFEHAPRAFGQAYLAAHLTAQGAFPELYGSAYFGANHRDGVLDPVRRGIDHVAWAGLVHRVEELAPRAIVATHHLPLVVLGRARRLARIEAPLVGVVTDYGTHAVWAEKGLDGLCVPSPIAYDDALAHGVAAQRLHLTGIPVRAAFECIADLRAPTSDETVQVLVTSGGFGVGPIAAIVRSFAGIRGVKLTVVCGRAKGLVRRVRRLADRLGVWADVLGYENDMPARVAAAHIVVGKAGGLTVSECLAGGRPMVIAGAVPGNETINAERVVRGRAGVVAIPQDVGARVSRIVATGALEVMGRRARRLVVDHAADRVLDVTLGAVTDARRASLRTRRETVSNHDSPVAGTDPGNQRDAGESRREMLAYSSDAPHPATCLQVA